MERTYKLEEEGLALQNKIKQAKQNLLKKGVLPDNPTDEDIQKVLKSAEIADTALQKLNVKLEGKNFRGQTQEGKRIRERSVPTKDLEGLLDPDKTIQESIDELQFTRKALDFLTNKSIVYRIKGKEDLVIVRYLKNQTDNGVSPELNTPKNFKRLFKKRV